MGKRPEHLRLISKAKWEDARRRAFLYAMYIRSYHPLGDVLADPDEVVQTAVEKLLSGEREWQPERCSLTQFLCGVVRSLHDNHANKLVRRMQEADKLEVEMDELSDIDAARYKEEDLDFMRGAHRYLKNNYPELAEFFILAANFAASGCETEGEIADALGLSQSAYTKRKQRVWERVYEWRNSVEFSLPNGVGRIK